MYWSMCSLYSGTNVFTCNLSVSVGDARVNEQVGLTAIHTVFHRYHNVLEDALYALHPDWKGEELFQEARHINIAIWQNIVYAEYLPVVVGPEAMRKYDLDIRPIGTYDSKWPRFNIQIFADIDILIIKIRPSRDRLIFIMGILHR